MRLCSFIAAFAWLFGSLQGMDMESKQEAIIKFWFGEEEGDYPYEQSKLWFGKQDATKNAAFDEAIRVQFEEDIVKASENEYAEWEATPKGRLALIILLDQFPRNIYRGTAKAFTFDPLAKAIAIKGVLNGDDGKLAYAERIFFYLPLVHQENIKDQLMGIALMRLLADEVPAHLKSIFERSYNGSKMHLEALKLFGRFPWRNILLGRESTPEEIKYLEDPSHHF